MRSKRHCWLLYIVFVFLWKKMSRRIPLYRWSWGLTPEEKQEIQDNINNKLAITDVINDLIHTDTNKALSANQGKVLKWYIDAINTLLASNDTTLDELQEIVNYIKVNRSTLSALSIASIAWLQAALDSKASSVHTHTIAQITGLNTALNSKLQRWSTVDDFFVIYIDRPLNGVITTAPVTPYASTLVKATATLKQGTGTVVSKAGAITSTFTIANTTPIVQTPASWSNSVAMWAVFDLTLSNMSGNAKWLSITYHILRPL